MTVTQREAGGKWCPEVRGPERVNYAGNMAQSVPNTCIGSRCMSWRWAEISPLPGFVPYKTDPYLDAPEPEEERGGHAVPIHYEWNPSDGEANAGWIEPEEFVAARRRGYCGRAGVPNLIESLIAALAVHAERIAP